MGGYFCLKLEKENENEVTSFLNFGIAPIHSTRRK